MRGSRHIKPTCRLGVQQATTPPESFPHFPALVFLSSVPSSWGRNDAYGGSAVPEEPGAVATGGAIYRCDRGLTGRSFELPVASSFRRRGRQGWRPAQT